MKSRLLVIPTVMLLASEASQGHPYRFRSKSGLRAASQGQPFL